MFDKTIKLPSIEGYMASVRKIRWGIYDQAATHEDYMNSVNEIWSKTCDTPNAYVDVWNPYRDIMNNYVFKHNSEGFINI